jgi:hypothetical protein
MIEPIESNVLTEKDAMDSIVLSTRDTCFTIQLLCHIVSLPYRPLQLSAYLTSSLIDPGYMTEEDVGGL